MKKKVNFYKSIKMKTECRIIFKNEHYARYVKTIIKKDKINTFNRNLIL